MLVALRGRVGARTLCEGIRAATLAIRSVRPDARIIVNEDIGRTTGSRECADQVRHDSRRRWLTFDLLTGRVDAGHPDVAASRHRPRHDPSA